MSVFFLKSPRFLQKTFSFREDLHFDNLKFVYSFARYVIGGQKLGNARNSNKAIPATGISNGMAASIVPPVVCLLP